jgi:hypothetical protein
MGEVMEIVSERFKVQQTTLEAYVRIITQIRESISTGYPRFVTELDRRRQELHDELLAQAGVDRENYDFICWVEDLLEEQEAA